MLILEILGGLLILVFLVAIHEFGHAIAAYRNGVVVEEFGIGFPPRAWGKKLKNGVLFTLNWVPIGGFVKLQGEHDAASKKGDYGAATFWQKSKILFAGILVNWLFAVMLLTILAWTGLPKIIPNQFSLASDTKVTSQPVVLATIEANSPAATAGFKKGDSIVKIDNHAITSAEQFVSVTKAHRGQTVAISYERNNQRLNKNVTLRDQTTGAVFGAGLGQKDLIRATWSAPIVGVVTTAQFTWVTLQGLGELVGNVVTGIALQFSSSPNAQQQASTALKSVSQSVAGPVGVLGSLFPAAEQAGLTEVVFITAIISLTLAVMNILPIPALDGGRWFVSFLFRLLRKPLTKNIEERIQAAGFIALMGLMVIITISDVVKIF